MQPPKTQFASIGDDRIAYQVIGDGPLDLVISSGSFSNVDVLWEEPTAAHLFRRLTSFSRLIIFDRRGSGLSDPLPLDAPPNLETWTDDLRAVMDAAGSERAAILTATDGGFVGIMFAATYPERALALVLVNAGAKFFIDHDYPEGFPRDVGEAIMALIVENWGTERFSAIAYPDRASDERFLRWFAKFQRASSSPRAVRTFVRQIFDADLRGILPAVRVPTLVMHRSGYRLVPKAMGQYLAEHIPGARFKELPGGGNFFFEFPDETADAVEEFLTGVRRRAEPDRALATVMFTDIVGSTDNAVRLGDRRWREILDIHDSTVRGGLEDFQGRLIHTTGDGVVATFDAPGRAIRCALELQDQLSGVGIEIRAGLHTGEVELRGDDIGGIAVHIASRVMNLAGPHEVLVSRTVKDLVAGSAYSFEDRGVRALKGVPDEWQVFALRMI